MSLHTVHVAFTRCARARAVRLLLLGVILLAAATPDARAYTLVFTDGRRVELVAEPVFKDGWADVRAKDGRSARLPVLIVGWTATNAANGRPPGYRSPGASVPKVWTNADIVPLRRARLSLVGEPAPASRPPEEPPGDEGAPPPRVLATDRSVPSEDEWRARAQEIAGRMADNEQEIARLEREEHAWESMALNIPSLSPGAASELIQVREALAAAQADQAAARAAQAALEEEARRAGVLPGWLR